MKQTLPAKLIAQFQKLEKIYIHQTGGTGGTIPPWLIDVLSFLEDYRHDSAVTMKQIARNWHRTCDTASKGNWADQMIRANEDFKEMNTIINA